jgi:hypothetical protein
MQLPGSDLALLIGVVSCREDRPVFPDAERVCRPRGYYRDVGPIAHVALSEAIVAGSTHRSVVEKRNGVIAAS